jgi:thiol:disulfide interchange protein DsbD
LFVVIAGNLFGMYEIALPASLVNSLNRKSSQTKGYGASFIMGMVFSLTAFTCTVPFIDLVGKISAGGEWFRPIIGMGVYSAVFALPFFLLALFPSSLTRLPKSGAWMNNIKVVFGFVELAFAVSYFARVDSLAGLDILSREAVLSIWAGCSLLITLYVLGVYRMQLDGNPGHIGGMRAILAVVFASLTLYIFDGIKSSSVGPLEPFVYVESSNTNVSAAGATSEMGRSGGQNELYNGQWLDDLDSALAIAKKINKPVFIDFTGISCTNCRWMEKNMFPKPEIRALMQQMVLVRAYTDRRHVSQDKKYQEMQEQRFHSTLLPLYVLLTPNDTFIASSTYTPSTQEFASFLKKAVPGDVNISALSPAH